MKNIAAISVKKKRTDESKKKKKDIERISCYLYCFLSNKKTRKEKGGVGKREKKKKKKKSRQRFILTELTNDESTNPAVNRTIPMI